MIEAVARSAESESVIAALIFSDGDAAARAAGAAVAALGGATDAPMRIADIASRLARQVGQRTIFADFSENSAERIEPAMASIEAFVGDTGSHALASAPLSLIDRLSASVRHERVSILCEPDLADRIAALAVVSHRPRPGLADKATDLDSLRLKRLADEVNRIARALSSLSAGGDQDLVARERPNPFQSGGAVNDVQIGFAAEPMPSVLPPASEIRAMLRLRRMRESFFDPELFADPAWDMMLDLLAARIEGDQVAVSSLCIAAAVPPTTALRWIKTMTDTGLLERHADPMDGRRIFIRLTDHATDALGRYFAAARRQGGMII